MIAERMRAWICGVLGVGIFLCLFVDWAVDMKDGYVLFSVLR